MRRQVEDLQVYIRTRSYRYIMEIRIQSRYIMEIRIQSRYIMEIRTQSRYIWRLEHGVDTYGD